MRRYTTDGLAFSLSLSLARRVYNTSRGSFVSARERAAICRAAIKPVVLLALAPRPTNSRGRLFARVRMESEERRRRRRLRGGELIHLRAVHKKGKRRKNDGATRGPLARARERVERGFLLLFAVRLLRGPLLPPLLLSSPPYKTTMCYVHTHAYIFGSLARCRRATLSL